jgi:hypothetical protein
LKNRDSRISNGELLFISCRSNCCCCCEEEEEERRRPEAEAEAICCCGEWTRVKAQTTAKQTTSSRDGRESKVESLLFRFNFLISSSLFLLINKYAEANIPAAVYFLIKD